MAGPLLGTKLHVPRRRRGLLPRPRLSRLLSRLDEPALVLVSAPAGFGKTTLLTEWLAGAEAEGLAVAWLSLDRRDNDPALFWSYVVAALRTAAPGIGAGALELLAAQSSTDTMLDDLLNELSALEQDLVLVLDDYHVVESTDVQDGVVFLLEHLPRQVHLVIATRVDPAVPLARLRARGELIEIRAADLRFSPDEATTYLRDGMGLSLTPDDVAALEGRTEGWIAALQLAALSLQGREDVAGFIAGFAGDDRFVVDYLVEEVLQRQSDDVRSFLLQTSVLSRLSGSLCDAVTGRDGGRATLASLDRGNLFLVPLDDRRQWYRYHHLFGDVLRARLLDEQPDDVPTLNARASEWYERNGEPAAAIEHALAAEDFERAAGLVELQIRAMGRARQEATLRGWLEALPDELFRVRPVLSIGFVGALMSSNQVEAAEARLRDAERWLDGQLAPAEMVVADDAEFRRLPTEVSMYRAGLALVHGDVLGTQTHARRALELAGPGDHLGRGAAACLLGLAYWTTGELDAAHRSYTDGMAGLERAGNRSDVLGGTITLADLRIAQGRLRDATTYYERGLRAATAEGTALRGAADMHVGLAELSYERNDLGAARRHLAAARELGDSLGLPQNRYRWRVETARLRMAEGDPDGALELLDEAERVFTTDFSPAVRPIPAIRARMGLAAGRPADALGWVRERGLSADDDLSYVREFEHVTLARVLLAQHPADRGAAPLQAASRLLERLFRAAEDGGRIGTVIEVLVLQARAHQASGDLPAASAALGRALALAEPEGFVRIFLDEGSPMAVLLKATLQQGSAPAYARELAAAIGGTPVPAPRRQGVVDPLSARELEVLRLLGTHLDGPEIARQLFVSVNTLRTHTKNIYAKLGVNGRDAAVRRAAELDLVQPH